MGDLVDEFQERLAEVETYLDFLLSMETLAQEGPPRFQGASHPISTDQQRILYSSVYLQLYNLIESTMSRCIETIVESAIETGTWKPSDLSYCLRREWVRVTACTHETLAPEKRLDKASLLCDHLINSLPIDAFKIDKGGGGNWDDAAIEAISARIGFQIIVSPEIYSAVKRPFRDDLGPLALVRYMRNALAHGSISFVQCAEDITVDRLIDLKDKTVDYLREVVDRFEEYIDSFEYLLPERRPS